MTLPDSPPTVVEAPPGLPHWVGRTMFGLCLAANICIVLLLRTYPFVDLPFHLAAAAIYHDYHHQGSLFPVYFTVRPLLAEPNVLHLLITGFPLNHIASVDAMNRLVLCVYVMSLPLIVHALIRRVGGNRWFALLTFPLVFNFNVAWGFVEFVMAIPLILLFLYMLMSGGRHARPTRVIGWAGGLVLLFYTHVLAMLFAAAVLVCSALLHPRDWRRLWWTLLALVPALGLTCWWWLGRGVSSGESTLAFLAHYYRTEYIQHFLALRRRLLTNDNTQLFSGRTGVLAALALTAPIVVPPLLALAKKRQRLISLRTETPVRALAAFTLVAFLCCMLLPDRIPNQTALYERFGVLLLLSLVLWSSVLYTRLSRRVALALCIAALGSTAVRVSYFTGFALDAHPFTAELLPVGTSGRTLLGLMYDERFRGHPAYRHFPDYYIAWNRGVAATELTQFRFGVVRAGSQGALPGYVAAPTARSFADANVDYVLVRGAMPVSADRRFEMVRTSGDWRLYELNVK